MARCTACDGLACNHEAGCCVAHLGTVAEEEDVGGLIVHASLGEAVDHGLQADLQGQQWRMRGNESMHAAMHVSAQSMSGCGHLLAINA
jgi:hypothetical protein